MAAHLFSSIACRKGPFSADCSPDGTIAFAASKFLALYSIEGPQGKLFQTLVGHESAVHCVRWPSNSTSSFHLVSGGANGEIVWWIKIDGSWSLQEKFSAHTGIVNSMDCIQVGDSFILGSVSSDNTLRIFSKQSSSPWHPCGLVAFGSGFALTVALALLPCRTLLIAAGGDDTKVHLYTLSLFSEGAAITQVASLQGHEDWVRALSFAAFSPSTLVLASGSQDSYIRLWNIALVPAGAPICGTSIAERAEAQLVQQVFTTNTVSTVPSSSATTTPPLIAAPSSSPFSYKVKFDALLVGHDDIVYSVRWHPLIDGVQPPFLLSSSMDKTMIVWSPETSAGIWIESARMGEVGGNTLGLFGGLFGPRGDTIIAHGFQGAFHVWASAAMATSEDRVLPSSDALPAQVPSAPVSSMSDPTRRHWVPRVPISGHFGPITDLAWDPQGNFIMSVSEDQTTRIFARSKTNCSQISDQGAVYSSGAEWHELARPQVHGYDMHCVAPVSSTLFVSGADEKVLRAFEAPATFLETFHNITGVHLLPPTLATASAAAEGDTTTTPVPAPAPRVALGASVPALGLSNKAVFTETLASTVISRPDTNDRVENAVLPFAPASLCEPPFEEHLLQNTLWPETRKLYGHGFELLCVAASHDGTLLASAAKSTKPEHSGIRLWAVGSWAALGELSGHTLSVTQLVFSHSDEFLVSVSRDRQWCLFRRTTVGAPVPYVAVAAVKAHERILWSVSWAPSDAYFATGSRDKTVKVWGPSSDPASSWGLLSTAVTAEESVTAVTFFPVLVGGQAVLGVGLESGDVLIYRGAGNGTSWARILMLPRAQTHACDVSRLLWSPRIERHHEDCTDRAGEAVGLLASGGRDGMLRVHSIRLALMESAEPV